MKYIKNFENFNESIGISDEIEDEHAQFDHSNNPVLKLQVKDYVQTVLYSNQSKLIFDELGIKQPDDVDSENMDSFFDEIEKKAIEFFTKNPHRMPNIDDIEISKTPISPSSTNTDGIPRVSNIGSSGQNM